MNGQGLVLGPKPNSYTSTKSGKTYNAWEFDLYDNTMGLIHCRMAQNGFVPVERDEVVVTIEGYRRNPLNGDVQFILSGIAHVQPRPIPDQPKESLPFDRPPERSPIPAKK